MKPITVEVRLLAVSFVTDETALVTYACQDICSRTETVRPDSWMVRTTVAKGGKTDKLVAGDSLIVEQGVKTAELRPMLRRAHTTYGWGHDEAEALRMVRRLD